MDIIKIILGTLTVVFLLPGLYCLCLHHAFRKKKRTAQVKAIPYERHLQRRMRRAGTLTDATLAQIAGKGRGRMTDIYVYTVNGRPHRVRYAHKANELAPRKLSVVYLRRHPGICRVHPQKYWAWSQTYGLLCLSFLVPFILTMLFL